MQRENTRKFVITGISLSLVLAFLIGKPDLLHKTFNQKRTNQKELIIPVNKLAESLAVSVCSEEFLESADDSATSFNVVKSGLNLFKARLAKEHKAASKNFSALASQVLLKNDNTVSNNKACIFPLKVSVPASLADSAVKTDVLEVSLGAQSLFCSKDKAYLSDYSEFYSVAKVLDSKAKELKQKKTVKALQKKLKDLKIRKATISTSKKEQISKIDKEISSLILTINFAKFLSKEALLLTNFFDSVCSQLARIATPQALPNGPGINPTKIPSTSVPSTKAPLTDIPPTAPPPTRSVAPTALPPIKVTTTSVAPTSAPLTIKPTEVAPSDFNSEDSIETIKVTNVRETPKLSGTLKGQQQIGSRGTIISGPIRADNITWWNIDFDSGADGWAGEDNYKKYQTPAATGCTSGQKQARVMYKKASVANGQTCVSETQTGTCHDGDYTNWTGTYTNPSCYVEELNYCAGGSANVISQFGITWFFDKAYTCGQFANGDYWVKGDATGVTITKITPMDSDFSDTTDMHGTMLNPAHGTTHGWDSRMKYANRASALYKPSLNIARQLPKLVANNSSVVSAVSYDAYPLADDPQLKSMAVLTVLPSVPAAGSFRPPLVGTDKTIRWKKSQLNYNVLANLAPVAKTPALTNVEKWFERPWIETDTTWTGRYKHPDLNYPFMDYGTTGTYGREIAHTTAVGLLSLQLNYTPAQKETLYIRMVQAGIDVYGAAKLGAVWQDGGGHNHGRKMVMLLAGKALGTQEIIQYANAAKFAIFQEDTQTFYVKQTDIDRKHVPVNKAPVEDYLQSDLGLAEWGFNHKDQPHFDNRLWNKALYRGLVGVSSLGHILTARIMGVESIWNHPAAFDYMDRFYSIEHSSVGAGSNSIQPFVSNMWKAYREEHRR